MFWFRSVLQFNQSNDAQTWIEPSSCHVDGGFSSDQLFPFCPISIICKPGWFGFCKPKTRCSLDPGSSSCKSLKFGKIQIKAFDLCGIGRVPINALKHNKLQCPTYNSGPSHKLMDPFGYEFCVSQNLVLVITFRITICQHFLQRSPFTIACIQVMHKSH